MRLNGRHLRTLPGKWCEGTIENDPISMNKWPYMRAPTNCFITYRITKQPTQSGNPSARQSPTVQPLKYAIPLHDYNTRNIDTTVSIGKEITTTRLHTQIHTLIPPRENQPQQVRERVTEALGAPDPQISTISLHDYPTRKHDTPISAITIEGYRNIDFITRLQDTQPPHQTTKLHANHISKPFWGNPFSNMHTTDESDRISLHSYYTRSIDNTISVHSPSSHTTNIPDNNKNPYIRIHTLNTNTITIEPARDPRIL